MATLYYFPSFHSLSSHKIQIPSLTFHIYRRHHNHEQCYSIFSASSFKKPRADKKGKNNAELFNDIREFLSTVGLPEDHVPSMKELSQHGRQDLANIVRRRGYKFIRKLLENSAATNFIDSNIEADQAGKLEALSVSEGQNEKLKVLVNDDLSSEVIQERDFYSDRETNGEPDTNGPSSFSSESTAISLQEKVARFIKHGELDGVEDYDLRITDKSYADEGKSIEPEDDHEPEFTSSDQVHRDILLYSSSGAESFNGNAAPSLVQKVEQQPLMGDIISSNSYISTEEITQMDRDKYLNVEKPKAENQAEVKRLKFMLHQKELELDHLKQQIEKEKAALSILQTKVETEISRAQKLITEKETELQAAEESFSGLKEVEVQYSGNGETVELAGSFNGWHHKIQMDPQPSSSMDPTGLRKSQLWRTVLWLYPGIYEIKFVVDGHWRIDPQRESITRDTLHNNILKVDR